MKNDFYEFEHRCDAMPEDVSFCKINGVKNSQFSIDRRDKTVMQCTAFYGFRFCPYCGERIEGEG